MKYFTKTAAISFALLLAISAHADDLESFLKRVGTGKAATNEIHEDFRGMVFVDETVYKIDREALFKNWEGQRAAKTELTVDKLTIVSKTETPDKDVKGAVISVVVQVSVTETVAGSTLKIESTGHYLIIRETQGAFRMLYLVVPKQVRKV